MKVVYGVKRYLNSNDIEVILTGRNDFCKVEHYFFEGSVEEHKKFREQLKLVGQPLIGQTMLIGVW